LNNTLCVDGVVYNAKDGSVYFSDAQHDRIMRVRDPMKGSVPEVWRQPSGGATGMTVDLEGRLIACESSSKRVTRTELDGRVKPKDKPKKYVNRKIKGNDFGR